MIKAIIRTILSILLVLLSIFAFFSCTSTGLQLLIKLTDHVIPGQLQATVVNGYLWGNLHLKNISYHDEKTNIKINDLQLSWYFKDFPAIIIALPHIKIADLVVFSTTTSEPVYRISRATLHGQLALADISPQSDNANHLPIPVAKKTYFLINWQQMSIPIQPSFDITFPTGKLKIDGPLLNYHVHGQFTSAGNNFPQAKWKINNATGNFTRINITSLTGSPLSGQVVITGQVTWLPDIKWEAHITGKKLNTAVTWATPTSNLDIQVHSQGLITDTNNQYRFELKKLIGTINNYPVNGTGSVLINNDNYEFHQVLLGLGTASLHVNGELTTQNANLAWQLHIPVLGDLLKDAKGSVNGEGNITGSLQIPHLRTNLIITDAGWRELAAKQIIIQSDGFSNLDSASQINVKITDLFTGNLQINSAQLLFSNKQKQNQLNLDLNGPRSQFSLIANGKFVAQQWQGKINKLNLDMKDIGTIKLANPANLILTQHSFAFQPFCLQAIFGQTCIQQANFAINPMLPTTKNKNTTLDTTARPLTGALQLSSHDLAFISVFWPQISNVRGEFNANFRVSGTTMQPVLSGQANLSNSSLSIPRLGINIANIMMHITGNQSSLIYKAQARFGKGILNIDGSTNLATNGAPSRINIRGNDLLVMNNSDAEVYVNPDLQLDWLTPLLNINGIITIPSAKITPRDLTATITLPKDVVFVRPDEKTEQQNTHIYSHVRIILGDNIKFDYSGLKGSIVGAVTVEDKPGGDTIGSGTLSIVNATYKAYGQNLGIRQGKLIFTGGPINNPGLNIQAVKSLQVVTTSSGNTNTKSSIGDYSSNQQVVGINISGTLSEPSAVLFSEPPGLSQSDILSYLITGRPASQATQQDSTNILAALSLLNLTGSDSGQIKNQFSSALGLSELSISHDQEYDKQQNSVVENTSLLLGKALSPRLMINYSLGLVEPINTLKIVYKIGKNFSLQSEHSTNANGVDLYYTIEKN